MKEVDKSLEGKVVFRTGGARGQGPSRALALGAAGTYVTVCDLSGDLATVGYALGAEDEINETAGAALAGLAARSTRTARRPAELHECPSDDGNVVRTPTRFRHQGRS